MQKEGSRGNRLCTGLRALSVRVVGALFVLFISWLLLLSGFSTSYLSYSEHTFFVRDSMLVNVLAAAVFLALLALLHWKKDGISACLRRSRLGPYLTFDGLKRTILLILLAEGVFWVLATQFTPGADQSAVLRAATQLRMKSSLLFSDGAYISKSPHQIGLVVFLYGMNALFGDQNIVVFQLLNAVGLMVVYKELSEISGMFGMSRRGQLLVAASGLIFFPLTMYTSLIYGNILGEAFALAAIQRELLYFRDGKKRHALLSAVWIALSVMMKQNYMVFLIGMVLYAFLELLRRRQWRIGLFAVLITAACVIEPIAPRLLVEWKTGYAMNQGMSSWSFIAMGLQDNGTRSAGWYNYYNDESFFESGNNPEIQAEMAKEDIRQSLSDFASNPQKAVSFFARKTASQWNNPTFQCFWIVQSRESQIHESTWLRAFLSIPVSTAITGWLNLLQFLILLGCLLHVLLSDRRLRDGTVLLEMLFVGGFLFHLMWEAKGQYTLSYFLLLLPCAVAGYQAVWRQMGESKAVRDATRKKYGICAGIWLIVLAGVSAAAAAVPTLHDLCYLDRDTQEYADYVQAHVIDGAVPDGPYVISTYVDTDLYLNSGEIDEEVFLSEDAQPEYLVSYSGVTGIRFVDTGEYLQVDEYMAGVDERTVVTGERNATMGQEWQLKSAGEDGSVYLLSNGDTALTYDADTGEVYIAAFDGGDNQKWTLRPGS